MPKSFKTAYGLDWDINVPEYQIELYMARYHRLPEFQTPLAGDPTGHFLRAVKMIFLPSEFTLNRWNEMTIDAWCHYEETVLMGCASASKSHSCGMISVLDWATAPHVTTTYFCSTDKSALQKRSWASVLHFYQLLKRKRLPAVYSKAMMAILNEQDKELEKLGIDAPTEAKSGLFAVASESGSEQKASSKFIGVHQPDRLGGVRMFADEAQAVRASFMESRTNLIIGSEDFRMVALGNPMSLADPLGQLAEPKKGWGSVTVDSETWENKSGGVVIHFDGLKSPAIEDPAAHPYLINQRHIDKVLKKVRNDRNHRDYMTMVRGWVVDSADVLSVFPVETQKTTRSLNREPSDRFMSTPIRLAGLDPAFSGEGDEAVLVSASLGTCVDGVVRLIFDPEPQYITVDQTVKEEKSLLEQRCEKVLEHLRAERMTLYNLGVDESGVQTVGATLHIMNRSPTVGPAYLVTFQERASDVVLSVVDETATKDRYFDRAAEGWSLMERFARFDQIRGLPDDVSHQFAARRWLMGRKPQRLESKTEFREREKQSPDAGDAAAVILLMVRHRFGLTPGGGWSQSRDADGGAAVGNDIVNDLAEAEEALYN
jgi:hypothetical protein